jgi:hypothetical protein
MDTHNGLTVTKFERTGNKNNLIYQGSTLEYNLLILTLFLLHQCPFLMIHLLF